MEDELREWALRIAKALAQPKPDGDVFLIQREDLEDLSRLLDRLLNREQYGVI